MSYLLRRQCLEVWIGRLVLLGLFTHSKQVKSCVGRDILVPVRDRVSD